MADKDDILRYNTKTRLIKEIIDNWDSIKIQSLSAKDNTKKKNRVINEFSKAAKYKINILLLSENCCVYILIINY